jgi:hypothetical protein
MHRLPRNRSARQPAEKENDMSKQYTLGIVVGLGLGTALYFVVVYLLPILGKSKWIWT